MTTETDLNGDWRDHAACAGRTDTFFATNAKGTGVTIAIERAKRICAGCPVLDECQQHALDNFETEGVWGGMSEDERRQFWRDTHGPKWGGLAMVAQRDRVQRAERAPIPDREPMPDSDIWDRVAYGEALRERAEFVAKRRALLDGAA